MVKDQAVEAGLPEAIRQVHRDLLQVEVEDQVVKQAVELPIPVVEEEVVVYLVEAVVVVQ